MALKIFNKINFKLPFLCRKKIICRMFCSVLMKPHFVWKSRKENTSIYRHNFFYIGYQSPKWKPKYSLLLCVCVCLRANHFNVVRLGIKVDQGLPGHSQSQWRRSCSSRGQFSLLLYPLFADWIKNWSLWIQWV